jgi:hypothetical protein
MTTFQDQPPQSRRALREQQLNERAATGDIDDSTEASRPAPSGRRAQRAEAPATLVEVAADGDQRDAQQVASDLVHARQRDAEQASSADSDHDDSHGEAHEHVVDSAVAAPFPFADQVEATSDDAGHPGFRLRDFSPELGSAKADPQSASDWTPARVADSSPLEYQTQGGPDSDSVVSSRRAQRAEAPAGADAGDSERPSFDSLFADLTLAESPEGQEAPDGYEADAAPEHSSDDTASERAVAETAAAEAEAEPAESVPVEPVPADAAPAEAVPAESVPAESAPVASATERMLSRREWRLMRARAEAEAAAAASSTPDATNADAANADATSADASTPDAETGSTDNEARGIPALVEPAPEVHTPLSDAMAEFEALTRGSQAGDGSAERSFPSFPVALAPGYATRTTPESTPADEIVVEAVPVVESSAPDQATGDVVVATVDEQHDEPHDEQPAAAPAAEGVSSDASVASVADERASTTTDADFAPRADATPAPAPSAPFSFLLTPPAGATPPVVAETPSGDAATADEGARDSATDTGSYTPPVGHWSRQAEMDDENQPFENTLSRDVGGGNVATTTNALVLPMIPQRDDFSSVLNATGEIMVTGTINLPGSVGSTGRDSRHYDDPDVDHLFDEYDKEITNTGSQPVRAISAVSSHTASRGGIETGRKQSNRMLNVLLVTACVLAVGTAALLVAGFAFNFF